MSADTEKPFPAGWTAVDFFRSSAELWQNWMQNVWPASQPFRPTGAPAAAFRWPTEIWQEWAKSFWPANGGGAMAWPALDPRLADWRAVSEYWVDAWQRTILFWDVMRQRGNTFLEHEDRGKPPLLVFEHEMVLDGRSLERPVNYFLVRIVPSAGMPVDPRKRPFVVFDPRAGHGPGIGGFKVDSEIGVAMKAGHPCYFVGFRADPEPGQTLEDVGRAEGRFLQKVAELHPEADGRPCIVGNCQAGWAVMMLSAAAPELMGPILLAGAPLSYWSGKGTQNPMRYTGGLLGGSWLASLAGDLGNGRFDGAHVVSNFESLNPANTLWTKQYNLYSKIDTEAPRYLEFERWWGGFFLMNEEEMRFIVDNLFVGNKLASGGIVTSTGRRIDLRNIKSPIVVFASWGDNITPPQQALNWILDCYATDREIIAREQTIVYLLHQDIGHLGIFVSGKVAQREHAELVEGLDLIELLPPGLWEMIIEDKHPDAPGADLIPGRYLVRFERRTLDSIRALEDTREDEKPFEAVARLSEINEGLYRTFVSPLIKPWISEATAETGRRLHPNRLQHLLWSDRNPWMQPVERLAAEVRARRRPVAADNPFVALERRMSENIESALTRYGDARDRMTARVFNAVYGSPWVQAALGLRAGLGGEPVRPVRDEVYETLVAQKIAALRTRFGEGGLREAAVRIMFYAGADEAQVDTRGFKMLQRIRDEYLELFGGEPLPAAERRELFKNQFFMLLLDEEQALATLPRLLPTQAQRDAVMEMVRKVLSAKGELSPARKDRLARVESILMEPIPAGAGSRRGKA
jgi:hypothetical protein